MDPSIAHEDSWSHDFYRDAGVEEYWIVDPDRASVRVVRRGVEDVVTSTELSWSPSGAPAELMIRGPALFNRPSQRGDHQ